MRGGWQVDQSCPQCGGPATLEETDHLLACPWCRVTFYIVSKEAHRYILPPKGPVDPDELVYAPYWRFKGVIFACVQNKVADQIVDGTLRAVDGDNLPVSLGLRPQVLNLRFLTPTAEGRFVKPRLDFDQALSEMERRLKILNRMGRGRAPFHSSYFGDTISLIYAPYHVRNGDAFDGVLDEYLGPWPDQPETLSAGEVDWRVRFIPAICPYCGWDLKGDPGTLVMVCGNCGQASASTQTGLKKREYQVVPGRPGDVHLPFWRLKPKADGVKLQTIADLIRITNQPRAVLPQMEEAPVYFWVPGFRVHGQMILRLTRNMTLAQPSVETKPGYSPEKTVPVTLNRQDAEDSLKTALAYMSMAKRNLFPALPDIALEAEEALLAFLPFSRLGNDLVHEETQMGVSCNLVDL